MHLQALSLRFLTKADVLTWPIKILEELLDAASYETELVTLLALLDRGSLGSGIPVADLAEHCRAAVFDDPPTGPHQPLAHSLPNTVNHAPLGHVVSRRASSSTAPRSLR
jgi:hypothetical protein